MIDSIYGTILEVESENKDVERAIPSGLALRVSVSIIIFFGWLIFAILYITFFSSSFSLTQNIAIILVALLVGVAILGAMWASWGIKFGKDWKEKCCK
ncbi:MAG: hypothetical protein O8C66_01045 [Candidatus Methanoperedens sp.]|nr:hypothetical protein [Candidatus Methanoperedens sp.]MCZ7369074.1 hypothetical protein [Candidatus Methanoperedens sp.]